MKDMKETVTKREIAYLVKETIIALEAKMNEPLPPASFSQIKGRQDEQLWYDAIQAELQNMTNMKVWREMDRRDIEQAADVIASQWVFTIKRDQDGSIVRKARLVACGNQESISDMSSYSPTSRPQTLRILLSVAAQRGLNLEQWDVKSAYLEAKLDQDVYLRPPPGVTITPGKLLKLDRALYGLRRAGRLWNKTLHDELIKLGFTQSKQDCCLYIKGNILILIYVDDILSAHKKGDREFERIKKSLSDRFRMKDLQLSTFLGVEIKQNHNGISINQAQYAKEILKRHGYLSGVNEKPTPMAHNVNLPLIAGLGGEFQHPYRQLVGELFYLVTYTRPDLAQSVGYLARFSANPSEKHWEALTRVLRYLKKTMSYSLHFASNNNDAELHGYSDSDFAGDKVDYKSTSGFLALHGSSIIDYGSVKQKTVARSSCEAEYVAAGAAASRMMDLRAILIEIGAIKDTTIKIRMDSQSAIQVALKEDYRGKIRHIGVQHYFLRDLVNLRLVDLEWVSTTEMKADIFTKPLDPKNFARIRDDLMRSGL